MRGPQSTPGGAPVSGAQVSKGISLTKQTPTPPRRPELPHRSRVSCPMPVVCTGGPWPRGLEAGGGLRQVRAGVGPWGGLGRVKGGRVGAQAGWGRAPSGPALCPPQCRSNGVFWADLIRLDLGGVSQGNCPKDAKLPGLNVFQPRRDLRPLLPLAGPSRAMHRVHGSWCLAEVMTPGPRGAQVP